MDTVLAVLSGRVEEMELILIEWVCCSVCSYRSVRHSDLYMMGYRRYDTIRLLL